MNLEVEEFSLRRVRLLTVILLIVVAVATALANLSSEPLTVDSFENMYTPAFRIRERAYGWPLAWYWRSAKMVQGTGVVSGLQWNVSRHSASCLTANLAMWLVMLAALSVASKWLLRRFPPRLYRPRLHGRPRVSTLIALMLVLAPMVLANLSFDRSPERGAPQQVSYGWPLIWHWRIVVGTHYAAIVAWDYSVAGLAGNVVLWILILAVIGLSCEWLLRRYPPRLRWSLRTMLAAVGLLAVLCAWCTAARRLAQEQDAVIAWVGDDDVYMERWGPKWLDLVGADRFRRRIVGARVCYFDNEELNELLFERLARLHGLRFLDIHFDGFTPGMAATLSDLQQLRILNVNSATWDTLHKDHWDDVQGSIHECLAAAGKLTQLERLSVDIWEENGDELACLADLTNLKSFTLKIRPFVDRADDDSEARESDGELRALAQLPVLPRLESLDLHDSEVGDRELGRLAGYSRLKSLNLEGTSVSGAGLAELAPLESLEELAIDLRMATAVGIESLIALKRLRAVHIGIGSYDEIERPASLALDDGRQMAVLSSELDGLHRSLRALRQSNPGIVIDAGYDDFKERGDLEAPWSDYRRSFDSYVRRWLKER